MAPVILEMDVHCYGCAKKIRKAIKNMPGVASVSASVDAGQVVVEGTADAAALQARLQAKLRKAVTIVSDGAEPEPDCDPPSPPHYPPPPPPASPPPPPQYAPPPPQYDPPPPPQYDPPLPPQYAPPLPPQYAPPPPGGYYHPYGGNPSATYDRQYVPNDGPTFFSDENPNACSIQ